MNRTRGSQKKKYTWLVYTKKRSTILSQKGDANQTGIETPHPNQNGDHEENKQQTPTWMWGGGEILLHGWWDVN
jgi:hypothetical protein